MYTSSALVLLLAAAASPTLSLPFNAQSDINIAEGPHDGVALPRGVIVNPGGSQFAQRPRPILVGGNLVYPSIKSVVGVARFSHLDLQPPLSGAQPRDAGDDIVAAWTRRPTDHPNSRRDSGSDVTQDRLHYLFGLTHNKPQSAREFLDGGLYARELSLPSGHPLRTETLARSHPRSAGEDDESGAANIGAFFSKVGSGISKVVDGISSAFDVGVKGKRELEELLARQADENGALSIGSILSTIAGFLLRRDESGLMALPVSVGASLWALPSPSTGASSSDVSSAFRMISMLVKKLRPLAACTILIKRHPTRVYISDSGNIAGSQGLELSHE